MCQLHLLVEKPQLCKHLVCFDRWRAVLEIYRAINYFGLTVQFGKLLEDKVKVMLLFFVIIFLTTLNTVKNFLTGNFNMKRFLITGDVKYGIKHPVCRAFCLYHWLQGWEEPIRSRRFFFWSRSVETDPRAAAAFPKGSACAVAAPGSVLTPGDHRRQGERMDSPQLTGFLA